MKNLKKKLIGFAKLLQVFFVIDTILAVLFYFAKSISIFEALKWSTIMLVGLVLVFFVLIKLVELVESAIDDIFD